MVAWEHPDAFAQEPVTQDFAAIWQAADKIVYSTTLDAVTSAKTTSGAQLRPRSGPSAEGVVEAGHQHRRSDSRGAGDRSRPGRRVAPVPDTGARRRRHALAPHRRARRARARWTNTASLPASCTCTTASRRSRNASLASRGEPVSRLDQPSGFRTPAERLTALAELVRLRDEADQPAGLKASSSGPCSSSQSRWARQPGRRVSTSFQKRRRVVRLAQVAELVHDDVVEHLERREHEPPVERQRAARGAGAPARALVADLDAVVRRRRAPPPRPRRAS